MQSPSSKYLYGRTSTFGTPLRATEAEEKALLAQLEPFPKERLKRQARALRLPTHEERRRIIEAPIGHVVVHGRSQAWGGVYVRDSVPTEGRRVWESRPEDEEWFRTKWEEK